MDPVIQPAGTTPATTPVTPPNPAFQAPPTGAPGGPPIPQMIPLTIEEYQRLRGVERSYAELSATQKAAIDKAETEALKAMADKGEADKALEQQRTSWEIKVNEANQKYQKLEGSLFASHQEGVLNAALSGMVFAGATAEDKAEAARQLRLILEPQFETSRDASGAIITREKASGRPAADALKEALASKKFGHFFSAQNRGGSGTDGTQAAANLGQIRPGSLEANKAFADQFKSANQKTGGGFGHRRVT